MPLKGYARVSTEDQTPLPQSEALKSAGCVEIFEEHALGGNRARSVLARVFEVIELLRAKGVFFRPLQDPIDTTFPQGMLTLQVPGAAAEVERALIRERTPRRRRSWQISSVKMLLERAERLGLLE